MRTEFDKIVKGINKERGGDREGRGDLEGGSNEEGRHQIALASDCLWADTEKEGAFSFGSLGSVAPEGPKYRVRRTQTTILNSSLGGAVLLFWCCVKSIFLSLLSLMASHRAELTFPRTGCKSGQKSVATSWFML